MTMTKRFRIGGVLAGLMALMIPFAAAAAPDVEVVESPGGVTAWLIHDPSLPMISMRFAFRGGAALDPADKAGLATMVSGLLDEGAGELDSLAFQQRLEELAIGLSFSADRDYFGGRLRTLSENAAEAFDILALALNEPRFDAEAVERIRGQMLAGLARDAMEPGRVARRQWMEAAYPDHPYGRPDEGSPETVAAITVEDLRDFVDQRLARDNLIVGVSGDIAADDLGRLLDIAFGGLPETSAPADIPEVEPAAAGSLLVTTMPISQSVVAFGQPGLSRADPDYYAAYLVNHVLGGGGFGSRLTEEVREKRGLAYGIYTYLMPMQRSAVFAGGVATQNERVAETIEIVRAEIARMRDEGLTAEELADAKTYLTGSFPLQLDSNEKLAGFLVAVQLEELGPDYFERRNAYFENLTLDEVNRVARDLLAPEELAFVIVGAPHNVTPTETH